MGYGRYEKEEMSTARLRIAVLTAFFAAAALVLALGLFAVTARADAGTVYTCTINRCYAHPVTGVIEDSGGEASYATGQGMVEGCVYPTGILEVTDSGEYYLTIRMSLMDYTSDHNFQVQSVGDSGWSSTNAGITGNGTDTNGTTADIGIQVPSENCVVRGSMYVEPMGRSVIFYLYPSDFKEGNSTDMNATIVTEASGSGNSDNAGGTETTGENAQNASETQTNAVADTQNKAASVTPIPVSGNSASKSSGTVSGNSSVSGGNKLKNSIETAASPSAETETPSVSSNVLDDAEGLSLSTAKDVVSGNNADGSSGTSGESFGTRAFITGLTVVVTGLILIAAVAFVVYYFHRNWRRWGGAEDDDEEE